MATLGDIQVWPSDATKRRQDRAVVLLLHGTGEARTWRDWTEPDNSLEFMGSKINFDHQKHPTTILTPDQTTHPCPLPVFTISGLKPVGNWKDFLRKQGHTVIAYSQDDAGGPIETAVSQFTSKIVPYVREEVLIGNLLGKKVTVLAQSRGGILIRKYLHDIADESETGSWLERVITLHSPHHGSDMAYSDDVIAELTGALLGLALDGPILAQILGTISAGLFGNFLSEGANELEPTSELIQSLNPGATPNPSIEFRTFGGTSVTLFRIYNWYYTPASYFPARGDWWNPFTWRWDWEQVPQEVPLISPLLDSLPNPPFPDELAEGKGDIFTANDRTKLAFAGHQSNALNHAECLWDPDLFAQVSNILDTPVMPYFRGALTIYVNGRGKTTPDPGSYRFSYYGHPEPEQVTATAEPDSGWKFDGWSGDVPSPSPTIEIAKDGDKEVTANFVQLPVFNLSIMASKGGSTNPLPGVYSHYEGARVTISARPARGWTFDRWGGDASGTSARTTVTMDSNKKVIAYYKQALVSYPMPRPPIVK